MNNRKPKKEYSLKLNSAAKIEELLQELYNECNRMITELQEQINKLASSVNLNQEAMDAKAKYSKAMNDFISSKEKSIARKLDIAKLMTEVLKYNGNMKAAIQESEMDWESFKDTLYETEGNGMNEKEVEKYDLKINK